MNHEGSNIVLAKWLAILAKWLAGLATLNWMDI